ncbi:hypothetical protein GMA8713_05031 [Grimontia marina]|uniref:Peptidase C39 domain-containing protein n=2 Tax=Grimontia marina TaxID=646534 RepID=A0A128FK84_9GAMM|nr:hypothetical protein GMA8713_05031 [Grimontia marina]
MQDLGHLAQEKFGLALTDIGLYDASKTTSTSLADNASKDVHGVTVIDANNSEYGDIFIDIEGAKTLHVNSLGQELIESKTLQEGGANDETQEALSQMFGGQLEKRVDQATGNQLASTSTAEFSNSLANSQSVFDGTQKADKVGYAKVDYYLTQTEAQRKVELTDFLLRCTSADCRATDEFVSKQKELIALNKTDTKRDEDYKSACQSGGGPDCNLESAKVVEAFNTYDKDEAVTDGTLSEYLDISTKYGESESRPWEVAATGALMELPSDALLGTLESVPELAGLAVTAASALAGDEQAQQQLEAMYLNIKGTISDPDGALDSYMADIASREASGEITSHEAKKEVSKFYISATTAVAGQTYGLVKVGAVGLIPEANIAGGNTKWTAQQPLDSSGSPIVRTNDRGSIQIQPNGSVTCGQHSCGMVLNTQGNPIAVTDIIAKRPPDVDGGTYLTTLKKVCSDNGVKSTTYNSGVKISQLKSWTSNGKPAIATVKTGDNTFHYVVVDGITKRNGIDVVAIRDPAGKINGGVYYETLESFNKRFVGSAVRLK